jgi:tellurite resistance protein TehA-like permease
MKELLHYLVITIVAVWGAVVGYTVLEWIRHNKEKKKKESHLFTSEI